MTRPAYIDDLLLTIRPGSETVSVEGEQPPTSSSSVDFAVQTPVDTATVYHDYSYRRCGNTGIDGGGAIVDNYFNFLPSVTVTAPAPKYGYSDGNIVVDTGSTPGGTPGGSSNGGNGSGSGQTGNPVDPNRAVTKTFAKKLTTTCEGLKKLWEWSYQNNNAGSTVEMGGYVLADGTFVVLPWVNNTGTNVQFYNGGSTFLADNGHQYSIIVPSGGPNKGVPILRDEDLVANPQNPPYTDIRIVSYVHTHPWTDSSHDSYNPTANTPQQEFGDWQLGKDFGIPGKIIVGNTILNFHYDSSQANPRVKDTNQSVNTICP